jgi:hypothetical protein
MQAELPRGIGRQVRLRDTAELSLEAMPENEKRLALKRVEFRLPYSQFWKVAVSLGN